MRNWCAAAVMSALFALPVCAQQNSSAAGDGDGSATAAATAEKIPDKWTPGYITPASRNLFALPEAPLPQPLPSGARSGDDTAPGLLVPKYEVAGLFNYAHLHSRGSFPTVRPVGGAGR